MLCQVPEKSFFCSKLLIRLKQKELKKGPGEKEWPTDDGLRGFSTEKSTRGSLTMPTAPFIPVWRSTE